MTESKPPAAKPRQVLIAAVALGAAALFSLLTPLGLSTQKSWLHTQTHKVNSSAVASAISSASKSAVKKSQDVSSAVSAASTSATHKYPVSGSKLNDTVNNTVRSFYFTGLFAVLILGFLAFSVWRGRHWSRLGINIVYALALFTPLGFGPLNLVGAALGGGEPAAIRIPSLLAGLGMLVAVVMVNMRPSVEFFALSKPAPRPGTPQRRGLFSRPTAPAGGNQPQRAARGPQRAAGSPLSLRKPKLPPATQVTDSAEKLAADRARTKKRANAESVARGAELARNRAKASKSRRTER